MSATRTITVLYFAKLREEVGKAEETIELPADVETAADLVRHLCVHDERAREAFHEARFKVAINHEQADMGDAVKPGDEVAFFPPVTGG